MADHTKHTEKPDGPGHPSARVVDDSTDAQAVQALGSLKSAPSAATHPVSVARLQGAAGNAAVSGLMTARALQRHSVEEAPPAPEQEEKEDEGEATGAQRAVQRHSVEEAPPAPEQEEKEDEGGRIQRKKLDPAWFGPGVPRVQRWGKIGKFFSGIGDRIKRFFGFGGNQTPIPPTNITAPQPQQGAPPQPVPMPQVGGQQPQQGAPPQPVPIPQDGGQQPQQGAPPQPVPIPQDGGQQPQQGAPPEQVPQPPPQQQQPPQPTPEQGQQAQGQQPPQPTPQDQPPQQPPQPIVLGQVTFDKQSVSADGTSKVRANVTGAGGQGVTWSFVGESFGSTIDPATGEITAGTKLTPPAENMVVPVMATSKDQATATAINAFELVEPTVFKARQDFDQFVAGSYSQKAVTKGLNGKYDAEYNPSAKTLTLTTPMRFLFPDDQELPTDTVEDKQKRATRHQTYIDTFINKTKTQWSGRYNFKNVREPQSVWGKLNPVTVSIVPTVVTKDEYFLINAKTETVGRASVGGGVANFFKGGLDDQAQFVAGTRRDELSRIGTAAPPVFVTADSKLEDASKPSVEFLSRYLRVIRKPKFNVGITGRDKTSADAAKGRAQVVADALTAHGLGTHEIAVGGSVSASLGEAEVKKVTFTPALSDPGFTNMQDTSSHEFGHMMGLPDEYVRSGVAVGDKLSTYDRMKAALGETYANTFGKVTGDAASIMEGGNDVRMHHYIHFWDTLVMLAGNAPVPSTKMGDADWKFYE